MSRADNDFLARVTQYVAVLGGPDAMTPPDVPSHIEAIPEGVRDVLNPTNLKSFRQTLLDYQDIFSAHDTDLGRFNGITHSIDTWDAKPIKQRQRRTSLAFEGEDMLEASVIEPSHSEWASTPVLVHRLPSTKHSHRERCVSIAPNRGVHSVLSGVQFSHVCNAVRGEVC